ncbi:MAG: hypothetical protein K6G38_03830, partial [Gammaproteobacteria bacterium]|nr:hypothetical protein [Gammaproteobacteria bacterium]
FEIDTNAFSYYETKINDFYSATGDYAIEIASSSRDIRLCEVVHFTASKSLPKFYTLDSLVADLMETKAGAQFVSMLMKGLKAQNTESNSLGGMNVSMEAIFKQITLRSVMMFAKISEDILVNVINSANKENGF